MPIITIRNNTLGEENVMSEIVILQPCVCLIIHVKDLKHQKAFQEIALWGS